METKIKTWATIWNNTHYRALFFQVLTILGVVVLLGYFANNTASNLKRQGIASGFGFLSETAGFDIIMTLVDYTVESSYGRTFWVGLLNTLFVSAFGILFATLLGFLIGIARLSKNWLTAKLATVYIELIRNIPLLLQIFFWYFAVLRHLPGPKESLMFSDSLILNNRGLYAPLPVLESGFALIITSFIIALIFIIFVFRYASEYQSRTGRRLPVFSISFAALILLPFLAAAIAGFPITLEYPEQKNFGYSGGMIVIPEFMAMLGALSLYTASFIAEIVRAGIQAVSHGQTEAAYSLGLRPGPALRLVIIPQALRVIIPPLTSQYLNLTKNSSLAAAIAYPELVSVFAGTVLNQTGQAVEVLGITMGVYLGISISISLFMNWYNQKIALMER